MGNIYNSDKPITVKEDDKFNRFNFSKRIAETIINRNSSEGLVLGIYGAWGEGKTSVLNILETELNQDQNIVIVKFNPWRFTTEDALIFNFFKNISEVLNKELISKIERVGNFIKKFGGLGGVIGLDFEKIGGVLSDTQLEDLKNRVNNFLIEKKKKVVIIIDDIDRLDKQELFSIFKLVKLTGDFYNSYYVLSFDDEMVASAIGGRYANGDKTSGHNFLEKIIQVPIRIPKALSSTLLTYTFQKIDKVLEENKIILSEKETKYLGNLIFQYVLPRITTPRLSVRFSNSLSFLLPLLKGEVNYSDLILLEAIKIFYPEHYDFIKNNPHFFITSYNNLLGNKDEEKVEELKGHLNRLSLNLFKSEKENITKLLQELFPRLNEALHNSYVQDAEKVWSKDKKIGAAKYFNRYFLYSVPDNEISDVYFDNFINSISSSSLKELALEFEEILKQTDSIEFLNKLSFYEDKVDWISKHKLIELLAQNQEKFEDVVAFSFGMTSPKSAAAITICRLLKSNSDQKEQLNIVKELLSPKVSFNFSTEILRWLKVGKTEEEKMFTSEIFKELNESLLERALKDSEKQKSNIFKSYDFYIFRLLEYWFEKDSTELKEYARRILEENPTDVETIIYSMTPSIHSSDSATPYKNDFQSFSYKLIEKYFDIELVNTKLTECFDKEIKKEEVIFYDNDQGQTKINALRQFRYWYEQSKTIDDLLSDS